MHISLNVTKGYYLTDILVGDSSLEILKRIKGKDYPLPPVPFLYHNKESRPVISRVVKWLHDIEFKPLASEEYVRSNIGSCCL